MYIERQYKKQENTKLCASIHSTHKRKNHIYASVHVQSGKDADIIQEELSKAIRRANRLADEKISFDMYFATSGK